MIKTFDILQESASEADNKRSAECEENMKNLKEMESKMLEAERQRREASERAMAAQNEVLSLQVVFSLEPKKV
jgi:hypothetical protein